MLLQRLGFGLFALTALCCASPACTRRTIAQRLVSPPTSTAVDTVARDAGPASDHAARDEAIASALAAVDVRSPAIIDAMRDVDGDGVTDALFHTEGPVAYGVARGRGATWTAEVLPRETFPQEASSWSASVPVDRGAAVLLVRQDRTESTTPELFNQSLEVLVIEPGAPLRSVFMEVFPTPARWTLRARRLDRLELHGAIPARRGAPAQDVYKTIRAVDATAWASAGCWGSPDQAATPTDRSCVVTPPPDTRERRWELYNSGPPMWPGQATLLYRGTPDPTQPGMENWCVLSRNQTFWVYLPRQTLAQCTPDGQSR